MPLTTVHLIHCLKIISQSEHVVTRQSLIHRHQLRARGGDDGGRRWFSNRLRRQWRCGSPHAQTGFSADAGSAPTLLSGRRWRWRQLERTWKEPGPAYVSLVSLARSLSVVRRCRRTSWSDRGEVAIKTDGMKKIWSSGHVQYRGTILLRLIAANMSVYLSFAIVHRQPMMCIRKRW